jgi:hypothetical protein
MAYAKIMLSICLHVYMFGEIFIPLFIYLYHVYIHRYAIQLRDISSEINGVVCTAQQTTCITYFMYGIV